MISNNGDDTDGNTTDDPTITIIDADPEIKVTKSAVANDDNADEIIGEDDTIMYTITIVNSGNVTITNLDVIDALTDGDGNNLVMTSDPTNQWTIANLAPGDSEEIQATYTIEQAAAETGSIVNVVTVTGDTPNVPDGIIKISDDPMIHFRFGSNCCKCGSKR